MKILIILLVLPTLVTLRHVRSVDGDSSQGSPQVSQPHEDKSSIINSDSDSSIVNSDSDSSKHANTNTNSTGVVSAGELPPPPPPDGGARPLPQLYQTNDTSEVKAVLPPVEEKQNQSQVLPPSEETTSEPENESDETWEKAGFGGPLAAEDDITTGSKRADIDHSVNKVSDNGEDVDLAGEKLLLRCGVCPPGTGVVTKCTKVKDTVCGPCAPGTYSPGYSLSVCRACNVCPPGYYQRTPCTADSNVRCGQCNTAGSGFGNEDFRQKCENVTTPGPTTTAPPVEDVGTTVGDEGSGEMMTTLEEGEHEDEDPLVMLSDVTVAPPVNDIDTFEAARVGESRGDQQEEQGHKVQPGGFQWPILLAGIASGIVFFIIGIVTSMLCRKSHHERRKSVIQEDFGENNVRTTMFRRSGDYSPSDSSYYPDSEANSPHNPVNVTALYHGYDPNMPRTTKSFYDSADLKYIDEEDSEDELVQRPPATPRSLISRIRDSPIISRFTSSPRPEHQFPQLAPRRQQLQRQASVDSKKLPTSSVTSYNSSRQGDGTEERLLETLEIQEAGCTNV